MSGTDVRNIISTIASHQYVTVDSVVFMELPDGNTFKKSGVRRYGREIKDLLAKSGVQGVKIGACSEIFQYFHRNAWHVGYFAEDLRKGAGIRHPPLTGGLTSCHWSSEIHRTYQHGGPADAVQ